MNTYFIRIYQFIYKNEINCLKEFYKLFKIYK